MVDSGLRGDPAALARLRLLGLDDKPLVGSPRYTVGTEGSRLVFSGAWATEDLDRSGGDAAVRALRGLHSTRDQIVLRTAWKPGGLRHAISAASEITLEGALRAGWPGVLLEPVKKEPNPAWSMGVHVRGLQPNPETGFPVSETVAAAARGGFEVVVGARPVGAKRASELEHVLATCLMAAAPEATRTDQGGQTQGGNLILFNRGSQSGWQQQVGDPHAAALVDAAERLRHELTGPESWAHWEVSVWVLATDSASLSLGLASVTAIAGPGNPSQPNSTLTGLAEAGAVLSRCYDEWPLSGWPRFAQVWSSAQLALFLAPPRHEVPGYRVIPSHRFGANLAPPKPDSLELGEVVSFGRSHGIPLALSPDSLTGHVFVAGTTGSGKTSTIQTILAKADRPFVVIEPTKSEYRRLVNDDRFASVVVRTAGATAAPLRLNPFAFEAGTPLQTHLDMLRAVFVAAFPMYGPMPYILERGLIEAYRRVGWDTDAGVHPDYPADQALPGEAFPTLGVLEAVLDEQIATLGYAPEQTSNLRAALVTRVHSLRVGARGQMLDCEESIEMSALVEGQTVVELRAMGDDDDKTFLMGLLVARLYETVEFGPTWAGGLRVLLVLEEAHRLLRAPPPTAGGAEGVDVRGKAVEVFENVLSEVRAHGVGVVVADQLPTRMAPGCIKVTNTRLIHRLQAADDAELAVTAMGMEPDAARALPALADGHALAFGPGMHVPVEVRVAPPPPAARRPTDSELGLATAGPERDLPRVPGWAAQRGPVLAVVRRLLSSLACDQAVDPLLVSRKALGQLRSLLRRTRLIPGGMSDDDAARSVLEAGLASLIVNSHYTRARRRGRALSRRVLTVVDSPTDEAAHTAVVSVREAMLNLNARRALPSGTLCDRCYSTHAGCLFRGEAERLIMMSPPLPDESPKTAVDRLWALQPLLSEGSSDTSYWFRRCMTLLLVREMDLDRASNIVNSVFPPSGEQSDA